MAAFNSPFLLLLLATTTLFLHTTTAANVVTVCPPLPNDEYEPIKVNPDVVKMAEWAVGEQNRYLGLVYSSTRSAEVNNTIGASHYRLLILAHDQNRQYNFYEAGVDVPLTWHPINHLNCFSKAPVIIIPPTVSAFEKGSSADHQLRSRFITYA